MPSISPHGAQWRAQVYVAKKRDSKVFRTRREAVAWAAAREVELRAEAGKTPAEKITLHTLIAKYIEEESPKKRGSAKEVIRLNAMLGRLPDLPLSEITNKTIQQYRDERLLVVKPNSVLRELGSLSSVFKHAIQEWHYTTRNPVSEIRKPQRGDHRRVTISAKQVSLMLRMMGYSPTGRITTVAGAVAVCFLAALRTGMREGELCSLTWDRVTHDYAHVGTKTTAADRHVPLTDKSRRLIDKMSGFDPALVFGLKAASCDAMFRKYRERAELSGFTFHDARHTAATWMVKFGQLNVLELCKVFGWTDPKMAMIYFNPDPAELAKRMTGRK